MKPIEATPAQYHQMKFDKLKLPNVQQAGPVSASLLSELRSPLNFILAKEREPTSPAMDWGNLVDCLWTTPEDFEKNYIVLPDDAPQRPTEAMLNAAKPSPASLDRQRWWRDFEGASEGKMVLTSEMAKMGGAACRMLEQHPIAAMIERASLKQVALFGENPLMPGTAAKCLLDLLPTSGPFGDAVVDLKTTNDIEESRLAWTMHNFDYVVKLSFYCALAEAAGFGPRPRAVLIWQQSKYPFEVKIREISPSDLVWGKSEALRRLDLLTTIDMTDIRPHIDTQLKFLSLPKSAGYSDDQ